MVRSKKGDDKSKEGATLSIDVDSFIRMRDSVVTQLATLQEQCRTISSGYLKYTNAVLGEHDGGADGESSLLNNALLSGFGGMGGASPAVAASGETKAQKKKRAHDPNAPKRPLTPYFLYMQTARPIIADDLGPDVAKGAVSAEGVRRWNAMAAADKQLWTNAYNDNLKLYNARVHSYKSGNLNAKDMNDEDAATYAEVHNIGVSPIEPTADGQLTSEAAMDPSAGITTIPDEDEDEPEAPKSTSKTKARGKPGKPSKAPTPASGSIVPPSSGAAIVPPAAAKAAAEAEKEKSPDKKRKRTSKAAREAEVAEEPAETPKTAEKKPRKKKSKSDA